MKKVTYLMTLIFAVALMSTSCCKDDPIVPDEPTGAITLAELNGIWVSTNYEYDGYSYGNNCSNLENAVNEDVFGGDLMLINLIIGTSWELNNECGDLLSTHGDYFEYDRDVHKLELGDATIFSYKFDVVSYDRVTEILILKLTDENLGAVYPPINGVYTLKKQ